ncbi:MAG: hypothetical protein QM783_03450 [Phycisphaerales bacterium]
MNDADLKLRRVARTTSSMLFALGVILFGLTLRNFAGLDQKEGAYFWMQLIGTTMQAIGFPLVCIAWGVGLRRCAAAAEAAATAELSR